MKYFTIFALVLTLFTSIVVFANTQTNDRFAEADCVVATAKEQGYTGDYYSKDAWDIFISQCTR